MAARSSACAFRSLRLLAVILSIWVIVSLLVPVWAARRRMSRIAQGSHAMHEIEGFVERLGSDREHDRQRLAVDCQHGIFFSRQCLANGARSRAKVANCHGFIAEVYKAG